MSTFEKVTEKVAQLSRQKSLRHRVRTLDEEISAREKQAAVVAGWGLEAQNDSEREWLTSRSEMYE